MVDDVRDHVRDEDVEDSASSELERLRAENARLSAEATALRDAHGRLLALTRELQVGVVVQGARAEIVFCNDMALSLLGLTEEQLMGKTSFDPSWSIVREDGAPFPGADRPVATVLSTKRPVRDVVMGIDRPGRGDRIWLLVSAEPQLGTDGNVVQVVATLIDLTERKRLEADLSRARRLESVGRLAGGVAHDFNNLLTVIVGYTTLVQRRVASDEVALRQLGEALAATRRAASLTGQLLTFARKQLTVPVVVDLPQLLRELSSLLVRLIGEHIVVHTRVPDDTWRVRVDPSQLEQVVVNLAVNARDAMPEGGSLAIDARNVPAGSEPSPLAGDAVVITVADTGQGMDEATRERIFEPFFTTKDGSGTSGTGLGLATVHGIVEQAGGAVTVASRVGQGTSFHVWLPRTTEEPSAHGARRRDAVVPRGRETVLAVEDDPHVRGVLVSVLAEQGYVVLQASSGAEALALAAAHPGVIDLLVTDVVMAGVSGPALAAKLREARPELRVLFVSGYAVEPTTLGEPAELGSFLAKPYGPDELARRVRETLDAPPRAVAGR